MQSLYYKAFNYIENSKPNHLGIYFSLFLHLIILLFAIGLPDFFKAKKIPMPQVIPIEILNVSDVTSEIFKISIGITWGIGIFFGLKKSGRPIANNNMIKCRKREK